MQMKGLYPEILENFKPKPQNFGYHWLVSPYLCLLMAKIKIVMTITETNRKPARNVSSRFAM